MTSKNSFYVDAHQIEEVHTTKTGRQVFFVDVRYFSTEKALAFLKRVMQRLKKAL